MTTSSLRRVGVLILSVSALVGSGCGYLEPMSDAAKTPDTPPEELPLVPRPRANPAAAQNAAPPVAVANETATVLPVHLSAGVGLPQTLPNGTAVGFSVDYQFRRGGPRSGTKYVWVIQRKEGEPDIAPVQLSGKGTLQKFLPWRPEQGPFESYVAEAGEDGEYKAISKRVPMR